METGLQGKKALVTGGGEGIGRAIATALADEGVAVAIANRGRYPDTLKEIRARGVRALEIVADISVEREVVRMVREAVDRLGGLDLFVNNAAAHWDEPVMKATAEAWSRTVDTNLGACVLACREAGRHFVAQEKGCILIVGSTAAFTTFPGEFAYRVTKTALIPYMECLATELAPFGIRVNMLTPGTFITRMTRAMDFAGETGRKVVEDIPLRRPGDAYRELAPSALLLLSDRLSGYTTGTNLVVDGGIRLRPFPWRTQDEIRRMNTP
jgi:NAD(P)-dependent dehydrogenase (short-subunit alcohol dehydrogenase family)